MSVLLSTVYSLGNSSGPKIQDPSRIRDPGSRNRFSAGFRFYGLTVLPSSQCYDVMTVMTVYTVITVQ
jgi:hypothetical protein